MMTNCKSSIRSVTPDQGRSPPVHSARKGRLDRLDRLGLGKILFVDDLSHLFFELAREPNRLSGIAYDVPTQFSANGFQFVEIVMAKYDFAGGIVDCNECMCFAFLMAELYSPHYNTLHKLS